jgi:hypothetical protein
MIETPEGGDYDLSLGGRISLIKSRKEAAASIEIGRNLRGRLQRRGSVHPLQQARLQVLNHSDLAKILAGCIP